MHFRTNMADALAFEGRDPVQREADRRDRKRKIESWTEKTGIARLSKDTAKTMEEAKDVLEDAVLGLVDLQVEAANNAAKTRILASVRAGYNRIHGLAVKLEVGNKYGTEAVDKLFNNEGAGLDLTEEQSRLLKAHLKEQEKAKKKKSVDKDEDEEDGVSEAKKAKMEQMPAQAMNMTWPGMMWPTMAPAYVPQYNMAPAGVSGHGMQQQQQMGGQMGGGQVGNSGRGGPDRKWRFPCDNCGNYGHWRHEVTCPNYHVYIARQQAAAAAFQGRAGQGMQAAAGSQQQGGSAPMGSGMQPAAPGTRSIQYGGKGMC